MGLEPRQLFQAFAESESATVSGSVYEQLGTDPRIREILARGEISEAAFTLRYWQGPKQTERCIIVTLDLEVSEFLCVRCVQSHPPLGVRL